MAVTYPKLHGAPDVVVKPGSLQDKHSADGVVWTLTLNGKKEAFEALNLARGIDLGTAYPQFGVPAGYYLDEFTNKQLLYGAVDDESAYEVDLVCRTLQNMGDGVVSDSIPEVYTVDWESQFIPLEQHGVRYLSTYMKEFVDGSKTLYGYIKDWIQAESSERQGAIVQEIMALGSTVQKEYFQDFIVMYLRGVTYIERFYPILTRTKRTNSVTAANPTPGQIDTPPSGFTGLIVIGDWSWRRMPTRIERIGRSGGYNIVDRWVGDSSWDTRLYGTIAEQGADYQTLG